MAEVYNHRVNALEDALLNHAELLERHGESPGPAGSRAIRNSRRHLRDLVSKINGLERDYEGERILQLEKGRRVILEKVLEAIRSRKARELREAHMKT